MTMDFAYLTLRLQLCLVYETQLYDLNKTEEESQRQKCQIQWQRKRLICS